MSAQPNQHSIVVRMQCVAIVCEADGVMRQCTNRTRRGYYCRDHADELLGLEVKTSEVGDEPGDAGLGLFTTVNRRKHEVVDEYKGDILTAAEFEAMPSVFGVSISRGRVVNPVRTDSCYARFSNDARNERNNNCWLISDRQYGLRYARPRYRNGSGAKVLLMTRRAVLAGRELLTSYGSQYWRAYGSDSHSVGDQGGHE
jgi:hypothetical protein